MTTCLFIYRAPSTLADAAAADPAELDAVMDEWLAWAGTVADEMVDLGTPLAGGVRVTAAGASPSTREVSATHRSRHLRVHRTRRDRDGARVVGASVDTYLTHATRTGGRRHRRTATPSDRPRRAPCESRAVREWALANGYEISTRGRISADIEQAYRDAP